MKIKAEWLPWLHEFRRREFERVFRGCAKHAFRTGLELGGGDGFQASLLTHYVQRLVCTDYERAKLPPRDTDAVSYRGCDAERIDDLFAPGMFDLVFSSNVLEHLPDAGRALRAIHRVLQDDGITIHVMPSPFWKLCHVLLHVPNQAVLLLERLSEPGGMVRMVRRLLRWPDASGSEHATAPLLGNNPKTARPPASLLRRLLMPEPHGVSKRNLHEFRAFSRARWRKEFARAGFDVLAALKGPVGSGYGFGLDRARWLLEDLGVTSEYIYVAAKHGATSRHAQCFADGDA